MPEHSQEQPGAPHQVEDAGAPELMDVAGELMADQRDLPGYDVQNLLAQRGVAGGNKAQDGHHDEQQRDRETKPA